MGGKDCDRCGEQHETIDQFFARVSMGNDEYRKELLEPLNFLPNSPTLFNLGVPRGGTLSACFKFDVGDSLLDGEDSIMAVGHKAAAVTKFGGGVGYALSDVRAKNVLVNSTHGKAMGPVALLNYYHSVGEMITQSGKRDAAQMAILSCDHPDIRGFIHAKDDNPQSLRTFNISVAVTDIFMGRATTDLESDEHALLNEIVDSAWRTGDPGLYFIDEAERGNPTPWLGKLTGTNPSMPAGTLVASDRGILPIESLEGKSFSVKSLDGTWAPAQCFMSSPSSDTVRISYGAMRDVESTKEHRWPVLNQKTGEVEKVFAADLQPGDYVPLNRNERTGIVWDPTLTEEDGFFMGFLFGDGWVGKRGGSHQWYMGITFGDDTHLAPRILEYMNSRKRDVSTLTLQGNESVVQTTSQSFIQDIVTRSGWNGKDNLPSAVWKSNDDFVVGFIDGLLSADGHVAKNEERVTLTTSRKEVASEYAKLLSFYGVMSNIAHGTHKATFPNGKDYNRSYSRYDVRVGDHQLNRFAKVFKISHQDKAKVLAPLVKSRRKSLKADYARIKAVEFGQASVPVWDITVAHEQHVFPTQWSYTGNCGEVPLLNNEPCTLGSINLGNYIDGAGDIDYRRLGYHVKLATRYLDDIVSINTFPVQEILEANLMTRKIGLGVCGWADLLALKGLDYDTQDAVDLGSEVMRFINEEAEQESLRLGVERGPAPAFMENSSFGNKPRNATRTCIAPTGSIAILMGASSGIEPHFALEWTRTLGNGEIIYERIPVMERIGDRKPRVSHDIESKFHVAHQSAFQKYTDLAVSKTVNLRNDATREDIYQAFVGMWTSKLKGGTIFRDGCRNEQVLNVLQLPEIESCPACSAGVIHAEGCLECINGCGWSACST